MKIVQRKIFKVCFCIYFMFGWLFNTKKEAESVKEETKKGFESVKKDIQSVSGWIKHLDSERQIHKNELEVIKEDLSSIREEIEGIKQKSEIIEEVVEKNGKKRVYIPDNIKEIMLKKSKVKVENKRKRSKKEEN